MNKHLLNFFFFAFALGFSTVLHSQHWVYDFHSFGVERGLPHRNVKTVFCDRDGMIWAATTFELSRLSGDEVRVFRTQELGKAVNNIKTITQDGNGFLWLWGERGLYAFDPDQETADLIDSTLMPPTTQNGGLYKYPLQLADGSVVFNPEDESRLLFGWNGKIETTLDLPYAEPFHLLSASLDGERLWARSAMNLLLLNREGKELMRYRLPGLGKVKMVTPLSEDRLLVFTEHVREGQLPLLLLCDGKGQVENLSQKNQLGAITNAFYEYKKAVLWLEYIDHWELRTLEGRLLIKIEDRGRGAKFMHHANSSWTWTLGKDGKIWAATETGVITFSSSQSRFPVYFSTGDRGDITEGYSIRGIWSDGKKIIASAELGGVVTYDLETKEQEVLGFGLQRHIAGKGLKESMDHSLRSDYRGLAIAEDGRQVWLGHQRVIQKYDPSTKLYRAYPPAFSYDIEFGINPWCFHQRANGDLLVGAQPGMHQILAGEDSLRRRIAPPPFEALNEAAIYQIENLAGGRLIYATSRGLFLTDKAGKITDWYHAHGNDKHLLPHDHIYGIRAAANGQLWLATNGSGLVLFSLEKGEIEHLTQREGLVNNVIYAVYEDEYGALWLPSDNGLMRLDTSTNEIKTYSLGDGLPANEFNRTAHFSIQDDRQLYFGTVDGLVVVEPAKFVHDNAGFSPAVQLLEVRRKESDEAEARLITAQVRHDSLITLRLRDDYFQLSVALADFRRLGSVFEYRIDKQEWQPMIGNTLQMSRFDYGEYSLEVRGKHLGGIYSKRPLRLLLLVEKPFWLQWYFFLGIILAAVLLTVAGVWAYTEALRRYQRELEGRIKTTTAQLEKDRNLIKAQAEELAEVDRMKTRLFANISHELRTPLTLIISPIRKLRGRKYLTKEDDDFLRLAEENSSDLLETVNSILELAKLDIKGIPSKPVPTCLEELGQGCVEKFRVKANQLGVSLTYDYTTPTGQRKFLMLDGKKVSTIINNLLANALRFTPAGGHVSLEVREDERVSIKVSDTGPGISAEDLPRLFDRFYQTENAANQGGGSGIGLALCHELTELMGGTIEVASQLGNGSVFTLRLPLTFADEPETNSSMAGTNTLLVNAVFQKRSSRKARILVVEDNHGMQQLLKLLLRGDYELEIASNGLEALNALSNRKRDLPDLIITDLMMPLMDGFTLVEELKKTDCHRKIPIIVLTARNSLEDRLNVLRYGVDDYLIKPFEEQELFTRIQRLLINATERRTLLAEEAKLPKTAVATEPEWLLEMEKFVVDHLSDNRLNAAFLANRFYVSPRQLQRRLKKETGLTTGAYIREVRLNRALTLLASGEYATVKETAAKVGFRDPEYFSTIFQNRFGRLPSEYKAV